MGSSVVIAASLIAGDPILAYGLSAAFLVLLSAMRASRETIVVASILLVATPVNLLTPVPVSIAFAYILAVKVRTKLRGVVAGSRYIRYGSLLLLLGFALSVPGWDEDGFSLLQAKNFVLYVGLMWVTVALLAVTLRGPRLATFAAAYVVVAVTVLIGAAEVFGTAETVFSDQFGDLAGVIMLGEVPFIMRRTILGPMVGTLAAASLALLVTSTTPWVVALFSGCLAVNIYFLAIGGSVGSLFATSIAMVAVAAIAARSRARRTAWRVLLLVGAVVGLSIYYRGALEGLLERSSARVVSHAATMGTTGGERYPLWATGLDVFIANPFGRGWPSEGPTNVTGDGLGPHNDYILYGIMYGALGALGYLVAVLGAVVLAGRSALRTVDEEGRTVALVGLGAAVVCAVNSFTDFLVADRWYFTVMWTLIALGLVPGLQALAGKRQGPSRFSGNTAS